MEVTFGQEYSETCLEKAISLFQKAGLKVSESAYREITLQLISLCEEVKQTKSLRLFEIKVRKTTQFLKAMLHRMTCFWDKWIIIRGLLVECFSKQLNNSYTVAGVLMCMEDHVDDCARLMLRRILFLGITFPTSLTEARRQSRHRCFTSYVLHHANAGRVMLNGRRFVSITPLTTDLEGTDIRNVTFDMTLTNNTHRISSLRILLQYGARLCDRRKVSHSCVPSIIVDTLSGIIRMGANEKLWDANTLEFQAQRPLRMKDKLRDLCACFVLLLKDTISPHEVTFYLSGQRGIARQIPNLDVLIPLYDELFPNHLYGRNMPSSLRHACRFVIRKMLYDNWNLPDGIQNLPIPPLLKEYINLLHD